MTAPLRPAAMSQAGPGQQARRVAPPPIDPARLSPEERALFEATKQLEAVFMRQIMATMRQSASALGNASDPVTALYQGMMDDEIADRWAATQTAGLGTQLFLSMRKHLTAAPVTNTLNITTKAHDP